MALTREEACAIVLEMWNDDTLAVAAVIESPSYFAVALNSREYLEAGDERAILVGGGSWAVPKDGGAIVHLWSGEAAESQLQRLEDGTK